MDYLITIKNYLFPPKNDYITKFIDSIDFDTMNTSDIVILLNYIKYENKIEIYSTNMNSVDRLEKLKYELSICLESSKDTTDLMIKYIKKYKGETYIGIDKQKKINKTQENLEKRYTELIKVDPLEELQKRYNELMDEDDEENNNDDDNEGASGIIIKKKISLLK